MITSLCDHSVYQHLSKETPATIHKVLINILQDYKNNSFISETEITLLRPHGSIPQQQDFMIFLKSTKTTCLCTHSSSLWHSNIQHCKTHHYYGKTSSFVKDSTGFIKKFKYLSINPEEETLVSFNVSPPFTSIPVPVATTSYQFQNFYLHNFTNVCKIPIGKSIKLLEFT